jgi:uncharacterized protein with FMN-binding domain
MRAAVAALVVTVVVVVLLVSYDTRPPTRANPESALRTPAARHGASAPPTPAPRPHPPGSRTAESRLFTPPYTRIQVQATVLRGRLIDVRTTLLGGSDSHTNALNARAEPILRKEALRAGNAEIDVVTGATTTSLTWIEAVQSAMERAGRG